MNQRGHILLEVLVSLSLLGLLTSIAYPLLSSLERIHQENRAYLEALQWMAQQVEKWRQRNDPGNGFYRIENITVEQDVYVWRVEGGVERGEFLFTWRYGEKEWQVKWVIDRCCLESPANGEDADGEDVR